MAHSSICLALRLIVFCYLRLTDGAQFNMPCSQYTLFVTSNSTLMVHSSNKPCSQHTLSAISDSTLMVHSSNKPCSQHTLSAISDSTLMVHRSICLALSIHSVLPLTRHWWCTVLYALLSAYTLCYLWLDTDGAQVHMPCSQHTLCAISDSILMVHSSVCLALSIHSVLSLTLRWWWTVPYALPP